MSTENDDHDGGEWDDPSDLTRLEDLSEFLHEEDPEVEAKLAAAQTDLDELPDVPNEGEDLLGLDDLEDSEESSESFEDQSSQSFEPPEFQEEQDSVTSFSEEVTNPNFEAPDIPDDSQNSDEENQSDDSDWNNSEGLEVEETSFSEDSFNENDGLELDSGESSEFESFDSDSNEDLTASPESEESNWETEDSFDQTEDEDQNDVEPEEETLEEQSFETEEQSFDSFDSEETQDNQDNQDDQFDSEDTDNFDESTDSEISQESANFELPDPSEINNSPPISSASATDSPIQESSARENFQDLRDFGNAITYGVVTTGGNPPFSLILRNIKFEEDAEDIKILLREHGLVTDDNEETINQGLEQGSLLISQISEYSAIFLAHKLRRFDVEIRLGLSDQLHPSKSYSREGRGLVSKYNLRQNHRESLQDLNTDVDIEDIKMSTTPTLDGYNIHRYVDVITSHTLIEEEELKRLHNINLSDTAEQEEDFVLGELLDQFPNSDGGDSDALQFDLGLNEIYRELVVELRNEAFKIESNAVVGINFNITPLMMRSGSTASLHYKITCSGNAVWIVDQQS